MSASSTFFTKPEFGKTLNTSVKAVRKARRAYFGLLGTAFDTLIDQGELAKDRFARNYGTFAQTGEAIENEISNAFSKTPKFVRRATPCGVATTVGLLPKRNAGRVAELEAEIEALNAKIKTKAPKTVKKTVKKAVAKTATKKKTVVKTPASTLASKTAVEADAKPARHMAYLINARRYDADASEAIVRKIVNHCGIALNSRDGKFVACSDEKERATVRESWLKKKLGLKANDETLDTDIQAVCETMKADKMKCRVTFYYLLAKNEGVLAQL